MKQATLQEWFKKIANKNSEEHSSIANPLASTSSAPDVPDITTAKTPDVTTATTTDVTTANIPDLEEWMDVGKDAPIVYQLSDEEIVEMVKKREEEDDEAQN
ncbi:hypothetical protein Hamer_G030113 [Homarus americanus]|uniref:Uncharacterized protein n=1 Tax=Homarus americanus TaxID=6706 RepID=A0A8J5JP92_HOMAM|nr:hypothetical protein Hamer_G030113 [Homarus americanus]